MIPNRHIHFAGLGVLTIAPSYKWLNEEYNEVRQDEMKDEMLFECHGQKLAGFYRPDPVLRLLCRCLLKLHLKSISSVRK